MSESLPSPDYLAILPPVLAGPLLRRLEPSRLVMWLVGSRTLSLTLRLHGVGDIPLDGKTCTVIPAGKHAHIHLIDVVLETPLPCDTLIEYDLMIGQGATGIADWAPHLLYGEARCANFVVRSRIDQLLHGSCRKPHHPAADGLLCVDRLLAVETSPSLRPALLMMSGDQVYTDDVAGPMLRAIHTLIDRLGLFDEHLEGAVVSDSTKLYEHPASYYHRADLLPALESNETLRERFFGGTRKPIFTSSSTDNHLVTFAEVMAMYLLVWSPTPWALINPQPPALTHERRMRYTLEQTRIDTFKAGLGNVARALAHLPSLMIFDDHDITDDWNLSAQWEETAYGHPFSKRIIGNALIAYMLCQGWGNNPDVFSALLEKTRRLSASGDNHYLDAQVQDNLIQELLRFQNWHFVLPATPALVVIDTRTRRWRSEMALKQPSGLLDWEALSELQQELLDHPSAIIVSPAPIFGVKLIETVQKIFSWCGYPLLVDAENWMAHRGAAQVILNIFRHSRTPGNYVVLSGDVHYSFVYEVLIRHRKAGPRIWQITSSGIKNEFPKTLLEWFDRLNRWLYSPRSPLNWLTKRRRMRIVPYVPEHAETGERLWNSAGIGQVFFNEQGQPQEIIQHNSNGAPKTRMLAPDLTDYPD